MIDTIADRLRGRSLGDVARLTLATLRRAATARTPAARAARDADRAFDRRWGTDTSDQVGVRALGFSPDRAAEAVHYQPSRAEKLIGPVAALGLKPGDYHFIDYGAGKGRIVMTAMELGFASVTGVELSVGLCDVARANLARFAAQNPQATGARILCADAIAYHPEGSRILAYFYNPFGAAVLEPVVRRLEAAVADGADEVYAIYVEPEHLEIFEPARGWRISRLDNEVTVARLIRGEL